MLGMSVASTIASELVAYPLFVVKTNMQAGFGDSMMSTARSVIRQRGFLAWSLS